MTGERMLKMVKRVISAIVLLALTALCFWLCTETAVLYVLLFGCLCCYELSKNLKKIQFSPLTALPCVFMAACAVVL